MITKKYRKIINIDEANLYFPGYENEKINSKYLYNFLSSPSDLANALISGSIQGSSGTYKKENSQYDPVAEKLSIEKNKPYSYVCLTQHPSKVAIELGRPFGLKLDRDILEKYLKTHDGLLLNHNQFKNKVTGIYRNNRHMTKNSISSIIPVSAANPDKTNYNDIRLVAVGKMKDNHHYFIKISDWNIRVFDSKDLYERLLAFLKDYSYKFGESDALLHIVPSKDNGFRNKEGKKCIASFIDYGDKHITHHPIIDVLKSVSDKTIEDKLDKFSEIQTTGGMNMYGIHATGTAAQGKASPCIQDLDDFEAENKNIYDNNPYMHLSKMDIEELDAIFNEYEVRAYIPESEDLFLEKNILKGVRFPRTYYWKGINQSEHGSRFVNIEKIATEFFNSDDGSKEFIEILVDKQNLSSKFLINEIYFLFNTLDELHLGLSDIEFFDYETDTESESKTSYYRDTTSNKKFFNQSEPDIGKTSGYLKRDLRRFLVDRSILDPVFKLDPVSPKEAKPGDKLIKMEDEKGHPTLVYTDLSPLKNRPDIVRPARIGAEGIIIGFDYNSSKPCLYMIQKPAFLELPGGSFPTTPKSMQDLRELAYQKIASEMDYSSADEMPRNLYIQDKVLVLQEGENETYFGQHLDHEGHSEYYYPYSAYWLLAGVVERPVSINRYDMNRTSDIKSEFKDIGRQLPLDYLRNNPPFLRRYNDILPIIDNLLDRIE